MEILVSKQIIFNSFKTEITDKLILLMQIHLNVNKQMTVKLWLSVLEAI